MIQFPVLIFLLLLTQLTHTITDEVKSELIDTIRDIHIIDERLDFVEDIINSDSEIDENIIALEAIRYDISNNDIDPIVVFLDRIGSDTQLDNYIRATGFKSAFRLRHDQYRVKSARDYLDQSYAIQPTRTMDELDQKADLYYQIAEDERTKGNYEDALKRYVSFSKLYPIHRRQQLQLYGFFELIPKMTMTIQKEKPNSTVVDDMIRSGLRLNNAGGLFGVAMMQFGLKDYSSALDTAKKASGQDNEPRWDLYYQLLQASVHLMNHEHNNMEEILNQLSGNTEHDNWLTYYVRIMGMTIGEMSNGQFGLGFPLNEWYIESPIYQDESRRNSVSGGSMSFILLNYAIGMTHLDPVKHPNKWKEFIPLTTQLYEDHFDKKYGKVAGLILAEHKISHDELEETERIILRVQNTIGTDPYLNMKTKIALTKLHEAKGNLVEMASVLKEVALLPDLEGDEEIERAKNDATYILQNNLTLQLILVLACALMIFLAVILIRYFFNLIFTVDLEK